MHVHRFHPRSYCTPIVRRQSVHSICKRLVSTRFQTIHSVPHSSPVPLVAIAFDLPNHGSRLHHPEHNQEWCPSIDTRQVLWDIMYSFKIILSVFDLTVLNCRQQGVKDVTALIDSVAHFLPGFIVQKKKTIRWGVVGVSLGGHLAFQLAVAGQSS